MSSDRPEKKHPHCPFTICELNEVGDCRCDGIEPSSFVEKAKGPRSAADILADMAITYRARNAVYGDNYKMVGPMMKVLFPNGVPPELVHSDQFHLFELILVKLSRFAVSGLQHKDSIHDSAVYGAMIEAILNEQDSNNRG